VGEMNERLRDVLVLSAISILLMIGTYKCGRQSVIEEEIYNEMIPETEIEREPEVFVDEDFPQDGESQMYHLIVGSFTTEEAAQSYLDQLVDKGFDPSIVENDGYYRISVFSSIYEEEVYNKKSTFSSRLDKMWVYTP
jgi:hypothetical protein